MKLKSGRGLTGRLRGRRERRTSKLVEGTKARPSVDQGSNRYGGDSATRSSFL
jgi:hypothetical protein